MADAAKLYIESFLDGPSVPAHDAPMATRRSRHDPLKSVDRERWLSVRDSYGRIVEYRRLDPGSDLKAAMILELARHAQSGWTLESYSSELACSFCRRGEERRQVTIEHANPAADRGYGNARGFE